MQHHAYYIEAPLSQFADYCAVLQPFAASAYERFTIGDARELIALASLKNFTEATFFIGASSITPEAQQALLKVLEEPQQGTTFVFLVPHGTLLPTVRSRMMEYPTKIAFLGQGGSGAATFLAAGGKERSDYIAKLLKDDEGAKDRVLAFVNELEQALSGKPSDPAVRQGLQDIAQVRDYLRDRSPSHKMLLEHLAVALPKV